MSKNFFNHAVYDIMWQNTVEPDRPQMAIWRMRFACWIRKAADIHSEYEILFAFPRHQRFCESAPTLRLYVNFLSVILCFAQNVEAIVKYDYKNIEN